MLQYLMYNMLIAFIQVTKDKILMNIRLQDLLVSDLQKRWLFVTGWILKLKIITPSP